MWLNPTFFYWQMPNLSVLNPLVYIQGEKPWEVATAAAALADGAVCTDGELNCFIVEGNTDNGGGEFSGFLSSHFLDLFQGILWKNEETKHNRILSKLFSRRYIAIGWRFECMRHLVSSSKWSRLLLGQLTTGPIPLVPIANMKFHFFLLCKKSWTRSEEQQLVFFSTPSH